MKFVGAMLLVVVLGTAMFAHAADRLQWDSERDRVDAQIESWTVPQVLQRISAITGWQILIDPTIKETVPAKFANKGSGDALRQLLGKLNFALAPETNGSAKLYVFRTSRGDATQALGPLVTSTTSTNKPGRISNELIVTLKPGESIEELAKRLGAKVVGKVDGLNAYRLRFDNAAATETARNALQNDPSVADTDYNFAIGMPDTPQPLGGAARPLGLVPKAVPDGQYTIVGLIDTAVQGKEGGISDFLLPGISVAGHAQPASGEMTHGTSMAGTLLRGLSLVNGEGSTTVRILPVDVYGNNPTTSTFDVAKGIYDAVNAGATIINLSLGSTGDSPFLYNTILSAHKQGVVFLGAAGNEPTGAPTYPAAYPEVFAVTASDRSGKIAPWANYGSFVDVVAPGTSIVNFNGNAFYITGTSTSTAWTSGIAAAAAEAARATGTPLQTAVRNALTQKPK